MKNRIFGSYILESLEGIFSVFRLSEDEIHVTKNWTSNAYPSDIVGAIEESLGFDLFEQCGYALGNDHPSLNLTPGVSMRDAFAGFESFLKNRAKTFKIEDTTWKGGLDKNLVTFGSPSSNKLSRHVFGYKPVNSENPHILAQLDNNVIRPSIIYDLSQEDMVVSRGRYNEPQWSLVYNEIKYLPRLSAQGKLVEDYLLLSCLPNLASRATVQVIKDEIELTDLKSNIPNHDETEEQRNKILSRQLELENKIKKNNKNKIFIIGGLHGPGTAAAKILFSNKNYIKNLYHKINEAGLSGKYWQALIHVPKLKYDPNTNRDLPCDIGEVIGVFPVDII